MPWLSKRSSSAIRGPVPDHYRGWPAVLARLSKLSVTECRMRLERAWRLKAPTALSRKLDESRMG